MLFAAFLLGCLASQAALLPSVGDRFGTSVCFVTDWDGDGRADLAIGNRGAGGGSVLVYSTRNFELVGVGQDLDGDGVDEFVMSDYLTSRGQAGRLYLCSGRDGSLLGTLPKR